jgi:predicted O-linked N-acetylglucosamine transferase (SPINDLY family)
VQLGPNIPEAWNNLGTVLKDLNQPQEAHAAYQKALALRPTYAVVHSNLGNMLTGTGDADGAEKALRQAIALDPNYAEAYSNFAHLITKQGRLEEAVALCRRAIQLKPSLGAAYTNLGTALHAQGLMDEGNEAYRVGAAMDPANGPLHENLLGCYNHTTRWPPQEMLAAHVAWAKRFAEASDPLPPAPNDRSPDRKLRIGYVSPDLRRHSVTYFLLPLLEHRDRDGFDVVAFSNTEQPDEISDRLRGLCDGWHDIRGMADDEVAALVRRERIDILIDLAGHTKGNRLPVFGRKPAPVQMTYLGYAGTTGLSRMDYRITDDLSDPPGMTDGYYTEKLIRLAAPFLCYRPPDEAPDVAPDPPVTRNGFVRFGSFNNSAKIGTETMALWSKLLAAVPQSRIVLKAKALGDTGAKRRIFDGFARHGIEQSRLELVESGQTLRDHLDAYKVIDVAIDTFPYNGTTTTCEALWMGVAVVSRVGQTHVARVGLSLLTTVSMAKLATESDDAFVAAAASLASDVGRLTDLRRTMRERVRQSPLCQAADFSRRLESALRETWRRFCLAP